MDVTRTLTAVAVALMVAGCSPQGDPGGGTPATPPEPPPAPATPAPQEATVQLPDPDAERPGVDDATVAQLVGGTNAFALDLYGRLAANDGNLFFSPHSVASALGMLYVGAGGETEREMAATLRLPFDQSTAPYAFHALQRAFDSELAGDPGYSLVVANRLWGQAGYNFRDEYLRVTDAFFGAGLRQLDFAKADQAADAINQWVDEQTRGTIPHLVDASSLGPLTRLVLTNAIYFKGDWARPFNPDATEDQPFYLPDGSTETVPLMRSRDRFAYYRGAGFQALELPYEGETLGMLVLLPDEVEGLPALEQRLDTQLLGRVVDGMTFKTCRVWLPRLELETKYSLKGTLSAMGMPAVMTSDADLSGISSERGIHLSEVVHRAFVKVDEEGTEAAAATGGIVSATSAEPGLPPIFRADHPFIFMIRHRDTGAILFAGRVANPAAG